MARRIKVEIDGINRLQRRFKEMTGNVKAEKRTEMKKITQDLKGKSQRLAPVDQGDLRGSAYAEVEESAVGLTGEVGYGVPYAIVQHERLDFNHPRGGKAKFLEEPFRTNQKRYVDMLSDSVKRGTRR